MESEVDVAVVVVYMIHKICLLYDIHKLNIKQNKCSQWESDEQNEDKDDNGKTRHIVYMCMQEEVYKITIIIIMRIWTDIRVCARMNERMS